MRHDTKSFRSHSYISNGSKQNKENQNLINIRQNRPLNSKPTDTRVPLMDKKISLLENDITPSAPLINQPSPKQSIKQQYSMMTGRIYSLDILNHYCNQSSPCNDFLSQHLITPSLRAKMLDWMIQVLSSYKMSQDTFFRAAKLMDSFLGKSPCRQQVSQLHLIGVASMFSACKYQEIYPIKLQTMYDKIARKKFSREQILQKESQIMKVLGFRLQEVNVYQLVKNLSFELNLSLNDDQQSYLQQILLYLSKMTLFSYELAQEDTRLLAAAVYFISLKTLEQVEPTLKPEDKIPIVKRVLDLSEDKIVQVGRKVLELAKNFSTLHPSLANLKKFNKFQYKKKSKVL